MSPLLQTFATASVRGWRKNALPKMTSATVYVIGGGAPGSAVSGSNYQGGNAGTVTTATVTPSATGTITVGAAASASSGFGQTGAAGTGLFGSQTTLSNTLYFNNYPYQTYLSGVAGSNHQVNFYGYYSSWPTYNFYTSGQGWNLLLENIKYASAGIPAATQMTNTLYYYGSPQNNIYRSPQTFINGNYAANTGSGGSAGGGVGYSGIVIMSYSTSLAPLTSTTGSVVYSEYGGNRYYKWTTSGSYVI